MKEGERRLEATNGSREARGRGRGQKSPGEDKCGQGANASTQRTMLQQ